MNLKKTTEVEKRASQERRRRALIGVWAAGWIRATCIEARDHHEIEIPRTQRLILSRQQSATFLVPKSPPMACSQVEAWFPPSNAAWE